METTATRFPAGSGWLASRLPVLNRSSNVSTRRMPACLKSASVAACSVAMAAVCEVTVLGSLDVQLLVTATTGFLAVILRAMRVNFRGLPNDSR